MFSDWDVRLLHRFRKDVCVQQTGYLLTFASEDGGVYQTRAETAPIVNALLALAGAGINWVELTSIAARGDPWGVQRLESQIERLRRKRILDYVWHAKGLERAVITALCPEFQFRNEPLPLTGAVALSRFAYTRRDRSALVLESPEALCRIEFTCLDLMDWLGRFGRPVFVGTLLLTAQPCLAEFTDLLWSTGFLERTDLAESRARSLWEFHDLLFHWRTRAGRVSGPQGGTFRFFGSWDAAPAIKPPMSDTPIRLPVPPGSETPPGGQDLITVLDKRRSLRDQGEQPILIEQLARLLYYTVRVQQRLPGEYQELLLRPVPAAGAIHEIECYLAVGRCTGLEPSLYHYHPERHTLYRLPSSENQLVALLNDAAASWGKPDELPQILIILTARFPRIAWKYEGIAYRLSLLNAGAIIQSLYLLATEMSLACSAIGGGDSALFAAATGLNALEETSIAEFAVGSLAPAASLSL